MRTAADVTVVGYLALDTITCPAGRFTDVPGGAALYCAAAASVAGARVALVARVGAGFPDEVLSALGALGVDLDQVVRAPHPCPRSRLLDPSGKDRVSPHHRDPVWWEAQRQLAPPAARPGSHIYVFNAMPAAVLAAQLDARGSGEVTVLDTSAAFLAAERDAIASQVSRVDVFAPSREETRMLMPGLDDDSALERLAHQVGLAVQKRGPEGLALRRLGAAELREPSRSTHVVDTTGAGDTVIGALAAGLAAGLADPDLLVLATVTAARKIAGIGPSALLSH